MHRGSNPLISTMLIIPRCCVLYLVIPKPAVLSYPRRCVMEIFLIKSSNFKMKKIRRLLVDLVLWIFFMFWQSECVELLPLLEIMPNNVCRKHIFRHFMFPHSRLFLLLEQFLLTFQLYVLLVVSTLLTEIHFIVFYTEILIILFVLFSHNN